MSKDAMILGNKEVWLLSGVSGGFDEHPDF